MRSLGKRMSREDDETTNPAENCSNRTNEANGENEANATNGENLPSGEPPASALPATAPRAAPAPRTPAAAAPEGAPRLDRPPRGPDRPPRHAGLAPLPAFGEHAPEDSAPAWQPPTPRDLLLAAARVRHPYAEGSGVETAQYRMTLLAKDAAEELREAMEIVARSRLTQPEVAELMIAFLLLKQDAFLAWIARTQVPPAAG